MDLRSLTAPFTRPALIAGALCALVCGGRATAQSAEEPAESVTLQGARSALARYGLDPKGTTTLSVIRALSQLCKEPKLSPDEQREARFLRAAAATDLLILSRVRDERALQPELETALGLPAGSAYDHFDAELAATDHAGYRELALQLRDALGLARGAGQPSLGRFRGHAGSQRDLLFVDALARAATLPGNTLAVLASYGEDPCAGDAACKPPYAAFDSAGRMAVAALAEAGRAMNRLHAAANAGDPLARTAAIELAVLDSALPAIELRPAPRTQAGPNLLEASGAPLAEAPVLLLEIGEQSVRYGFVPSVHLAPDNTIALVALGEPALPATAELPVRAPAQPFVLPLPELIAFLQQRFAELPQLDLAMVAAPGVSAHRFGSALLSLKRTGHDRVTVIGRNARGEAMAQAVRLSQQIEADAEQASELALRVRLGGYSLRSGKDAAILDIPRVRAADGFHFDAVALGAQLAGLRVSSSQVSFMSDVAAEHVTLALLEVAKSSRSCELVLP
jgi:hypothetical protein